MKERRINKRTKYSPRGSMLIIEAFFTLGIGQSSPTTSCLTLLFVSPVLVGSLVDRRYDSTDREKAPVNLFSMKKRGRQLREPSPLQCSPALCPDSCTTVQQYPLATLQRVFGYLACTTGSKHTLLPSPTHPCH